nr:MAG TPA: hypothetical protein [Caudoviricetes sp.]
MPFFPLGSACSTPDPFRSLLLPPADIVQSFLRRNAA